ncbi:MAG: D-glycero-beta-D-manno-heptose-7-phosphate kinase [Thermodesulfobacteriota bacterium]
MDATHKIPDFSQTNILVVGDVMLDRYFWGDVKEISPEAPVPIVKVKNKTNSLGGAGNVAANLTGVGCQPSIIGVCGMDKGAGELENLLRQSDIGNILIPWEGISTTTKTRIMGARQQMMRLDEEMTDEYPDDICSQVKKCLDVVLPKMHGVILSDYGKGLITRELGNYFINRCKEQGIPVFVDPKQRDWNIYRGATCLTPNTKEFQQTYYIHADYEKQGFEDKVQDLLQEYELEYLLVTQGEQGMTLFESRDDPVKLESIAREVYDVSGAGDTVIATLAASYCSGVSMPESGFLANYAASLVVGKLGTQPIRLSDLYQSLRAVDFGTAYKIFKLHQARELVERWQKEGNSVVFTNGCFDLLHSGHIRLLHQASELGDKLIVGLNSDSSIQRIKGEDRPILTEQDRATILAELESVDSVVIFEEDTPYELIQSLRPDVLVKGNDYELKDVVGRDLMESWGGRVELIELEGQKSSTGIVEKIRNSGNS